MTATAAVKRDVKVVIDGKSITAPEGATIYDAAKAAGINIPVLCHKEPLAPVGVCRVCAVEVKVNGRAERVFAAACCREISAGMEVTTTGKPDVDIARKTIVEMLMAEHPSPCARHKQFGDCELELLAEKMGIVKPIFTPRAFSKGSDTSNASIAIDHSDCILCDRCVRACAAVENNVIGRMGKGYLTSISFDDDRPMGESSCVNCGECMVSCPTGAITYAGGTMTKLTRGHPLSVAELKQIPMFAKVSSAFLARSVGAVVLREFKKGEVICRQGEFGSTAFYIDSGSVDIYLETDFGHIRTKKDGGGFFKKMSSMLVGRKEDKRKEEGEKRFIPIDATVDLDYSKPIAMVGPEELIGEAACLNFQPRSATVRAREDTIVLEMLRNALDILRKNREFRAQMEAKYRLRALDSHLRSVPIFRDLPSDFLDYLRERVQLVSYEPGQVICRQGDVADALYLVRMGHVKVFESYVDGQLLVLSYLSRSQYFGEIGLLGGGIRTANCSALDHVELVRIGKAEFDEMMLRFPQIRNELQAVADDRLRANEVRATQLRTLSLPQYIEQGLYQAQSLLILDLEKCTRCDECVRACAQAHDGITRLVRDGIRFDKYLVTTSCRSCRDPLCMVGCPVGSIRRKNNMEIIIEDHCIGCGRCAEQCPYGNINMHPFTGEMTDPVTGEKRDDVWRKAAVCDLCTDQCLEEDEVPSCVYSCPHDAAHRVNGQTFFDAQLLGTRAAAEKVE